MHIGLCNNEQAIDWLEKAFAACSSHMLYIKQGAQFGPLRDDPRFISLIQRMGWQAQIPDRAELVSLGDLDALLHSDLICLMVPRARLELAHP